jgi:O-antigen/teichoic acid export membrane protein
MSTPPPEASISEEIAADLPPAAASPAPIRPGIFQRVMGKSGRGIWPLADQGVASLGNIITGLVLARELSKSDFGIFSLIFEAIFFLLQVHAGLVTYPLTVRGAVADTPQLRQLTSGALLLTLLLAIPFSILSFTPANLYHMPAIGLMGIGALIAWQMQEVSRRALLSQLRFSEAVWGDAVSYMGQAAVLVALAWAGRLTLMTTLAVMAATSVLALLIQAFQVGLTAISREEFGIQARDFWVRGRWVALTSCSNGGQMVCGNWALGLSHGVQQIADFNAVAALLKFCNPIVQMTGNVIVPACAKATDRGGISAARRTAIKIASMAGLLLAPGVLLLLLIPGPCLRLVYHGGYSSLLHQNALRLMVLGNVVLFANAALGSFLNGTHKPRYAFYAQLVGSISMVLILLPLNLKFGWFGYAVGGVIPILLQMAVLLWFARKVR